VGLIIRDISARKRTEAGLRASEERFAELFRSSPAAMGILELEDYRVVDANDTYCRLTGYPREELIGRTPAELGVQAVGPARVADLTAALLAGEPVSAEAVRLRVSSGAEIDLLVSLQFIQEDGRQRLLFTGIDMTRHIQAEDQVRAAEGRLRAIFAAAAEGFVVIDGAGIVQAFNAAAERAFGYARDEVVGKNVSMLMPSPQREEHDGHLRTYLATGVAHIIGTRRQEEGLRKDGSRFPLEIAVSEAGENGQAFFIGIVRDISDQKLVEEALQAAMLEAERANQAKNEFLSRMSHELRTPLNVILGFGQLLEMENPRPEQLEGVQHILQAGRHLLDLIDEVLNISRIEAGKLSLSIEVVLARELVEEAVALISPLAHKRGITLTLDSTFCDTHILADRQRLKQVLLNLLSNGVKYNRDGGTLDVACERREGSRLRISIRDSGAGLSTEQVNRLFVPFDRLGAENTSIEGTGLGLPLSKRLVEAMGGAIGLDSVVPQGTTFWIELPEAEAPPAGLASPPAAADLAALPVPTERKLILYVEDNLANLRLVERLLQLEPSTELISAMQGSIGIDLARQHRPNLIILDLHLPDIPGDQVLARLQADPATRDIPVVVASADSTPGRVRRLKERGARAYLTKPFDVREFLQLIREILQEPPEDS